MYCATCVPRRVGRIKAYEFSSMDNPLAIAKFIFLTMRFLNIRFLSWSFISSILKSENYRYINISAYIHIKQRGKVTIKQSSSICPFHMLKTRFFCYCFAISTSVYTFCQWFFLCKERQIKLKFRINNYVPWISRCYALTQ